MKTFTVRLEDETYEILERDRGYLSQSSYISELIEKSNTQKVKTIGEKISEYVSFVQNQILAQREEILKAFVAKYGYQPEEVEQVVRIGSSFEEVYSVRRKEESLNREL